VKKKEHRTRKNLKWFGLAPLFDPEEGFTVVAPLDRGPGWWAGAPNVIFDDERGRFFLSYRFRKPRELGRGVKTCISESSDGKNFSTIWEATKDDLGSPSLERCCLSRNLDGSYTLYISYVDPEDLCWRIDPVRAERPEAFDLRRRSKVFSAADVGVEGVKDPYVFLVGGIHYMFISYVPSPLQADRELRRKMHESADVFNTGISRSHTALAKSHDGDQFRWLGDIFSPERGWDGYATRIGSLLYTPPGFTIFYDGSATVKENYEEKTGIAFTYDLKIYEKLSVDKPILVSPHYSGSLRYLDAVEAKGGIYYYYEYARPDGSHELRMNMVDLSNPPVE